MTDPIERVARAIVLNCMEPGEVKMKYAQRAISEYKAWLTEQGIPVEKLLSGEMVAVPAGFLEAAVPINNAERLVVEYAVMKCGHETVELTAAVMNLREMRKQAQLDYAGNPPVTPEDCELDPRFNQPSKEALEKRTFSVDEVPSEPTR